MTATAQSQAASSQTFIIGDVYGPVLSGNFYGPVSITPSKSIDTAAAEPPANAFATLRETLIANVREIWLTRYLFRSFDQAGHIPLRLTLRPDLVDWLLKQSEPEFAQSAEFSTVGTTEVQLFDGYNQRFVLLGSPGSGKTVFLARLVRDLLEVASESATAPIPVILRLETWRHALSLSDWMQTVLCTTYGITEPDAKLLMESGALAFLFDGLDEVPSTEQMACVQALNQLVSTSTLPLVVTCRERDYLLLGVQLQFRTAFRIEPLTPVQIRTYLQHAGARLDGLRMALASDAQLRALSDTPLMLSLLEAVFRNHGEGNYPAAQMIAWRRELLWNAYVHNALKQPERWRPYTPPQVQSWLTVLATMLKGENKRVFSIDDLQPSWLIPNGSVRWYRLATLVYGSISTALLYGLLGGLAGLVISTLMHIADRRPLEWDIIALWAMPGLQGSGAGACVGVIFGDLERHGQIVFPQSLRWSWGRMRASWPLAIIAGLCTAAGSGYIVWSWDPDGRWGIAALLFGLVAALTATFTAGVRETSTVQEFRPDAALRRAWWQALGWWVVLVVGISLVLGGILALGDALLALSNPWMILGLALMICNFVGALTSVWMSGLSLCQHYILRFFLEGQQRIPPQLPHFLGKAIDTGLLKPFGSGYMFYHDLLLDHLADQTKSSRE